LALALPKLHGPLHEREPQPTTHRLLGPEGRLAKRQPSPEGLGTNAHAGYQCPS
jgi:hypothetical protein